VILSFESAAAPLSVYRYYDEQARANGWIAFKTGALGVTNSWRKTYPDGARATLGIFTPRPWEAAAGRRRYELTGSIAPPR